MAWLGQFRRGSLGGNPYRHALCCFFFFFWVSSTERQALCATFLGVFDFEELQMLNRGHWNEHLWLILQNRVFCTIQGTM